MENYYHVMSRGTAQWNVFLDDHDRDVFLRILARACRDYGIEVHSYCLMGNHFHLLLCCPTEDLPGFMRDSKSRYARYFNERHARNGPLFRDRYLAKPITDDSYFIAALRYIHRNPLDLDSDTCLRTYPWSSHGVYLSLRPRPRWLNTDLGLALTHPNYSALVETPQAADKIQNCLPNVTVPGTVTLETTDCTIAEVILAVAHAAQCAASDVTSKKRNGLGGLAALVVLDHLGMSSIEAAEPLGYKSDSGVRMAAKRGRSSVQNDVALRVVFNGAIDLLGLRNAA